MGEEYKAREFLRRYPIATAVVRDLAVSTAFGHLFEQALVRGAPDESDPRQAEGQQMVDELAKAFGTSAPVFVSLDPDGLPALLRRRFEYNAFNLRPIGGKGVIAMSTKLYDLLDAAERRAVLAHEMSHQIHRDGQVLTVGMALIEAMKLEVSRRQGKKIGLPVVAAYFSGKAATRAAMRRIETRCDRDGATVGGDPDASASALAKVEKAVRANQPKGVLGKNAPEGVRRAASAYRRVFATHPSVPARIDALARLPKSNGSDGLTN